MSWLFDFFKKLWKAIKRVLTVILIILAVVLLVMAVFATGGLLAPIFGIVLTTAQAVLLGVLAITGAFLLDPETASEVTGNIAEAVGSAAGAVAGVVGAGVSGAAEGLFESLTSSPLFLVALGVGAYFLLKPDSENEIVVTSGKAKPEPIVAKEGDSYGSIAV